MDREGTATKEFVLGKAIAEARHKAGMTQQDLCQKANLSYSTLAKIERGAIKTPSLFTVAAIAEATNTPLQAFVGNESLIAPNTPQKAYKTAKNGIKFVYFDVNGVMVRFFQRAFTDLADDADVQRLLKEMDVKNKLIGAVCAAPFALNKAGVLKKNYTCYPSVEEQIGLEGYTADQMIVEEQNVIT